MGIELLPTVADQLRVGRPVPFAIRDEAGNLLLAAGSRLSSDAQVAMLLERGLYVELPDDDDDEADAADAAGTGASARRLTLFERWKRMVRQLERLLAGVHNAGFEARCTRFADELQALVDRDPDIAIYQVVRQDSRELIRYGLHHALHCAVLAHLAGRRAGWPAERAASLVRAALTQNLAIVDVQGLYASLGRLSPPQRERIQAHPQLAAERLREAGIDDEDWLQAVLQHHERDGGGGYPQGLATVHPQAQALQMIDSFLTRISPRAAKPAVAVQDAARELFQGASGHPLAAAIIKEFGIVPPGHFVQLASGELAIVIRRGATAHTPLAAAVTDAKGRPVMATTPRDTAQAAFAVRGTKPDPRHLQRVPPERLYGLVE